MRLFTSLILACLIQSCSQTPSTVTMPPEELNNQNLQPYAVQLHLHGSGSEGNGSLSAGNRQAKDLGIDVLFWTDHDFRISNWTFVKGFDFDGVDAELSQTRMVTIPTRDSHPAKLQLTYALTPSVDNGNAQLITAQLTDKLAFEGNRSFQLTAGAAGAGYEPLYYDFSVTRKRMHRSLAADVRLKISVFTDVNTELLPAIRVRLSQHFEENKQQEIRYILWNEPLENLPIPTPAHVTYIPLEYVPGKWNTFDLNISKDAIAFGRGGLDNALSMVSFGMEVGADSGTVYFDDYQIQYELDGDSLHQRILAMADSFGNEHGVINYIGQEISYGRHVNTWGSWIPMVDYSEFPNGMSYQEAVDYTKTHQSIASINHYIGSLPKNIAKDSTASKAYFDKKTQELVESRAWSADLLEIQSGSDNNKLWGYVHVWDRLGKNGLYLTGDGVSDAHNSGSYGWTEGGNLVTWILASSPSERNLLNALRKGAAYFGDPALFRGSVSFLTEDGHSMGQVVATSAQSHTIHFKLTELPLNSTVNIVADGDIIHQYTMKTSDLDETITIPTTARTFVRLGVWTEEGRGILFTNPIYFVPLEQQNDAPLWRLTECQN